MPRENFTFLLCKYKEQHNKTVSVYSRTQHTPSLPSEQEIFSQLSAILAVFLKILHHLLQIETHSRHRVVCGSAIME
jgi:hypothetical protein